MSKSVKRRFLHKVAIGDACWEWTAAKCPLGYGRISVTQNGVKRSRLASRVSWQLHYGEIPHGMDVCHKCDHPPCVRPDHLFLGTAKDNIQDASRKGRMNGAAKSMPGERHPMARLTWQIVREIRASNETSTSWAKRLGMHLSTICYIRKGKLWKETA